jgi:hypothetical protein
MDLSMDMRLTHYRDTAQPGRYYEMQVDLSNHTLKDVECWLISQIRGEKRNRGSGSTISEDNPISRQFDESTL